MRFLLVLFTLIFVYQSYSQVDVTWGEVQRRKGQLLKFMPTTKADDFYTARWTGSRLFGNYLLSHYQEGELKKSVKVKMHINKSVCSLVGIDMYQNRCAVFLSDIQENSNVLYLRTFSDDLEEVVTEKELARYEFEKGHQKGMFGIRFSADRNYMAVVWEKPGKKNAEHIYGYRVFDANLEIIHEGEYPLPFQSDLSEIQGHYISNRGDYFLAVTEYDLDSSKWLYRNQRFFKSLHLYHLNETGLLDYSVDLENRRIYTLSMTSDDSSLVNLSGLYGNSNESGIKGVFFQKIDLSTEKKIAGGFCELKTDVITQGWSDKALKKLKKREEKGKDEAIFFNYEMRETYTLNDSSIVGSMEQHYIQERMTDMQQSGLSSNTFYYYYNDIIVYKIGKEHDFDWIKKIRKYQVSTNDGGPYSGFVSFRDSNNLYFMFNDHIENYDSTGNFIDAEEVYITNYSKKKNVVVLAKLNMQSGEIERRIIHTRREKNFLFVPKLCYNAEHIDRVYLYGYRGAKETIGIIRYD